MISVYKIEVLIYLKFSLYEDVCYIEGSQIRHLFYFTYQSLYTKLDVKPNFCHYLEMHPRASYIVSFEVMIFRDNLVQQLFANDVYLFIRQYSF